jgi:anti-sigma factor RsiW
MDCDELVEVITEYLEGTLPQGDRVRFEKHLAVCPGCQEYMAQMRLTIKSLGSIGEEGIPGDAKSALLEAFRDWKNNA